MARSILDGKYKPEPIEAWDLEGYWFDFDLSLELYKAWKDHGVMAVAGGYLDQPTQWRSTIRLCEKLYATQAEPYMELDES
jgi:hypothetical protein